MRKEVIVLLILFMFLSNITVFAITEQAIPVGTALRVTLVNQEPDPVEPGSVFDVRFKIENIGSSNAEDVLVDLIQGESLSKSEVVSTASDIIGVPKSTFDEISICIRAPDADNTIFYTNSRESGNILYENLPYIYVNYTTSTEPNEPNNSEIPSYSIIILMSSIAISTIFISRKLKKIFPINISKAAPEK